MNLNAIEFGRLLQDALKVLNNLSIEGLKPCETPSYNISKSHNSKIFWKNKNGHGSENTINSMCKQSTERINKANNLGYDSKFYYYCKVVLL
jgi:hypothetical protein